VPPAEPGAREQQGPQRTEWQLRTVPQPIPARRKAAAEAEEAAVDATAAPASDKPSPEEAPSGPASGVPPGGPPGFGPGAPSMPGVPPGYMFPPPWYPLPMMPPAFGYGPYLQPPGSMPDMRPPGLSPEQAAQMPPMMPPVVPMMPGGPGAMPQMPPGFTPVPYPQEMEQPPLRALEDEEFGGLAEPQPSHWRGDLKWVFGVLAAMFVFATILVAGMYRVTSPGAAREVLEPIIANATQVNQKVEENYQDLRSKARRSKNANIYIPDIGVTVSIKASDINSLSSEDLAGKVDLEVARQIYSQGYRGNLPMESAHGVGEERAKAVCATLLGSINKKTHSNLLWPLIIFGVLSLAFLVLCVVFCNAWGKVIGAALVLVAASLPFSLLLRVGNEFIWKAGASGLYRSAMFAAMRSAASSGVVFFDIVLGLGALLLLVGIVGNVMTRKSRSRVPPFTELQRPEEVVVGGPPVEPGLHAEEEVGADAAGRAFRDIEPPPGDSIKEA
jgi:hypothetical protein